MLKTILKIFFIGLIVFLTLGYLLIIFIIKPLSQEIVLNNQLVSKAQIKLFETQIKKPLLNLEYADIQNITNDFIEQNNIININFKLLEYYVSVDALLKNSSNVKEKDWVLSDIAIDNKFGTLFKVSDSIYRFDNNPDFKFNIPIKIKFQARDENNMENSISTISFLLPEFYIKEQKQEDPLKNNLKKYLQLTPIQYEKTFLLPNNMAYANMKFSYHQNDSVDAIYNLIIKFGTLYITAFTILFFLYFLISYFYTKALILNHLNQLETYIKDIKDNNFFKYDAKKFKHKKISYLAQLLNELSKKIAAILNELNINKDLLEQQISTDNVTKLPNRKKFESDLKSLFVTHVESYIGKIRLISLKEYAQNKDQDTIDDYIRSFIDATRIVMEKHNQKFVALYRIFGSEFAFIIKYADENKMYDMFDELDATMESFHDKYNIEEKIYHGVAMPLHKYTSIDIINKTIEDYFTQSIEQDSQYYLQSSDQINQESERLEKIIRSIIANDAFSLSTKFDTFNFEETPQLVMQEIAPNLINTDGKPIPIGTFISVAEALDIAIDFDKNVILKTFKLIKQKNLQHEVAVNLSISSMCDSSFITWLETQMLYDYKEILDKIVFSITSFAATNNFEEFVEFSKILSKFKAKIILKRFNYNDLSMEQLERLNLSYIRIHKEYTTNIDHEREIIIKNIVSFASLNDTKVLGDLVSNENDYNTIKNLKFYGTSR